MNKKVYGSEKIFNMAINLILLLFGLIALYLCFCK